MSDSELSSVLSSPPSSEDEAPVDHNDQQISSAASSRLSSDDEASNSISLVRKKRPASPPRDEVLADNPDIAFIVMFRARFSDAFPAKLTHFGPQDIEKGVVDSTPSPQVENLLCALLGLVLNRQRPVEQGHYGRALEEAIAKHKSQWPRAWNGINPISGGRSFIAMNPVERLSLLRSLVLWALNCSDTISGIIKDSFKQSRHNDDLNQPLSVQPWGKDANNRQYWLIEGRDDTYFRLYREGNRKNVNITWRSEAGTIEELRFVSQQLATEEGQASRRLSERILNALPRFEATEEKRKRREYRQSRKAAFSRPVDYGLYEGRTRGKRLRYTYDDDDEDEDDASDETSARRSARESGRGTPTDVSKPRVTASGRHVKARVGGLYGESLLSWQHADDATAVNGRQRSEHSEDSVPHGRPTRSVAQPKGARIHKNGDRIDAKTYQSSEGMDDEGDSSGADWDNPDGDDEGGDEPMEDDEDDFADDSEDDVDVSQSLVVKLKLPLRSPSKSAPSQDSLSTGNRDSHIDFSSASKSLQSASTAPTVEPPTQPQTNTFPERLMSQTNRPIYASPAPFQNQSTISTYFQPAASGT